MFLERLLAQEPRRGKTPRLAPQKQAMNSRNTQPSGAPLSRLAT
jgi:hypothetical protein